MSILTIVLIVRVPIKLLLYNERLAIQDGGHSEWQPSRIIQLDILRPSFIQFRLIFMKNNFFGCNLNYDHHFHKSIF